MAHRFDFTGKEVERLKAEHALALNERRGQIGMTDDGEVVIEEPGIWDPFTGERLSPEEEAELEAQSRKRRLIRRHRMSG